MATPKARDEWRDLRKRRRLHYGVLLGGAFIAPMIGAVIGELTGSEAPYYLAMASWMAATLFTEIWLSLVKCPRCHRPFFRSFWFQHLLLYDCIHCHTPRYSDLGPTQRNG